MGSRKVGVALDRERIDAALAQLQVLAGACTAGEVIADPRAERILHRVVELAKAASRSQARAAERSATAELVDTLDWVYLEVRRPWPSWNGTAMVPGAPPRWEETANGVELAHHLHRFRLDLPDLDERVLEDLALDSAEVVEQGGPREAAIWAAGKMLGISRNAVRKRIAYPARRTTELRARALTPRGASATKL